MLEDEAIPLLWYNGDELIAQAEQSSASQEQAEAPTESQWWHPLLAVGQSVKQRKEKEKQEAEAQEKKNREKLLKPGDHLQVGEAAPEPTQEPFTFDMGSDLEDKSTTKKSKKKNKKKKKKANKITSATQPTSSTIAEDGPSNADTQSSQQNLESMTAADPKAKSTVTRSSEKDNTSTTGESHSFAESKNAAQAGASIDEVQVQQPFAEGVENWQVVKGKKALQKTRDENIATTPTKSKGKSSSTSTRRKANKTTAPIPAAEPVQPQFEAAASDFPPLPGHTTESEAVYEPSAKTVPTPTIEEPLPDPSSSLWSTTKAQNLGPAHLMSTGTSPSLIGESHGLGTPMSSPVSMLADRNDTDRKVTMDEANIRKPVWGNVSDLAQNRQAQLSLAAEKAGFPSLGHMKSPSKRQSKEEKGIFDADEEKQDTSKVVPKKESALVVKEKSSVEQQVNIPEPAVEPTDTAPVSAQGSDHEEKVQPTNDDIVVEPKIDTPAHTIESKGKGKDTLNNTIPADSTEPAKKSEPAEDNLVEKPKSKISTETSIVSKDKGKDKAISVDTTPADGGDQSKGNDKAKVLSTDTAPPDGSGRNKGKGKAKATSTDAAPTDGSGQSKDKGKGKAASSDTAPTDGNGQSKSKGKSKTTSTDTIPTGGKDVGKKSEPIKGNATVEPKSNKPSTTGIASKDKGKATSTDATSDSQKSDATTTKDAGEGSSSMPPPKGRPIMVKPAHYKWRLDSTGFECQLEGCDKRCIDHDDICVICPNCGPCTPIR